MGDCGVICSQCPNAAMRNGFCRECWARHIANKRRIYRFTAELRDALREAYCLAKPDRAAAIAKLQKRTGWPRHAFHLEAGRMGIQSHHPPVWSPEEENYLAEAIGTVSLNRMSLTLKRSPEAIKVRAARLHFSRRVKQGYNLADLCTLFGETHHRVKRWMDRGLLGKVHEVSGLRVTEENVLRFIRDHHAEYNLRRVDQYLFKAMVFEDEA
ncbi:MAG: hypothetical protein KGL39_11350 [Patescibacteria group bacterium]|nr:hypothetical protein [Patescibacteria group bacterium]